jgi:hypothetical protein
MAKSRKYGRKVKTMRKKNRKSRRGGGCPCKRRGGKLSLRGGDDVKMSADIFARNTNSVINDPVKQ